MAKTVPVGVEHYKKIVGEDYYYVDKTLLVKDILDSGAKVNLFTRPRRFGKTLAMSMLQTFFEDERDAEGKRIDNSHYFTGKNISSCGEKYLSKQGNYPVINLTLKEVGQPDFEQAYAKLYNGDNTEAEIEALNSGERKYSDYMREGFEYLKQMIDLGYI
ncbi:MAG: AAA family ATPase, partial [Lachnospiraceae bacterium]|nr:AAA family ATPase [Lachnospiraceae bacterium]